ncbi:MAG: hypothetical protein ICV67_05770 [Thermoleophilia bacterium]|nr:hypothetical protein [Thermoleophilia bacterium]
MKRPRTRVLALVAVLALAGAGAALAVTRGGSDPAPSEKPAERAGRPFHHSHHRGSAHMAVRETFSAAADYVGLTREDLLARLREGQSLAEIAEAEGKSVDGLKRAIRAAITARLDAVIDDLVHRARGPRG